MNTFQIVEAILRDNERSRNSDKELEIDFFDWIGVGLTDKQKSIIRDAPSLETLTRARRKIQEQGKYLASEEVRKERKFKSFTMQQRIPQTPPQKIPQIMQQQFSYPEEWL